MTQERRAVLSALRGAERPLTRLQIARMVEPRGVDQSSVYRTLALFTTHNVVEVFENANHEQTYELRTAAHHHHLVCERCGTTKKIRCPLPAALLTTLERKHTFHTLRHTASVYGQCDPCYQNRQKAQR